MDYIEIYESFNVAELQLVKHALANENIDFKVLNETLLQTGNAEAMGYSGARIQVNVLQANSANQILIDLGFKNISTPEEDQFAFMRRLEEITDGVPLLNQLFLPLRLVAIVFIIAVLTIFVVYYFSVH